MVSQSESHQSSETPLATLYWHQAKLVLNFSYVIHVFKQFHCKNIELDLLNPLEKTVEVH